jgi:predicted dehydrogenase
MDRLRVGVVGVGHLGRHHARILAGIEGVELVGVADLRLENARAVAAPLGTRAFPDHRQLIGLVDAVSIAVPTSLHRSIAGAFLERGIPALVEKPLAASLKEAEELNALARSGNAMLQVGHIERFNPALRALDGLGFRPKYVAAERMGTYTFRSTDIGVVLDLMIHDIDLLLSLVPTPVRAVSAIGVSLFGGHEDVANARIEFEDGCVANLTASRASYHTMRKLRLWSGEGYATLDFATRHATIVRPSDRLRQGRLDLEGLDITQPAAVKDHIFGKVFRVDQVPAVEARDALTLELADFVDAVRRRRQPRVTGADALRAMRVADQVLSSLAHHQWEGRPDGPVGPRAAVAPQPITNLPAPKAWRYRPARVPRT